VAGLRVPVNAGITAPITVAKTVRMIEVLTDRPKIGPNIPIGIRVGLMSNENQKKTIYTVVRHA
jgi:hypothetical protein